MGKSYANLSYVVLSAGTCIVVSLISVVVAGRVALGQEPVAVAVGAATSAPCGGPLEIRFNLDANGHEISYIRIPLQVMFTDGNIFGPIAVSGGFTWSANASGAFEVLVFDIAHGNSATNPDTLLWSAVDGDNIGWTDSGLFCTITVVPSDTGTVQVDTLSIDSVTVVVLDESGTPLEFSWQGATIVVSGDPCPCLAPGDVTQDGNTTSADIIALVQGVFNDWCLGRPSCWCGDANCNGSITSADIIYLINFIYKGGPAPCDYCATVWNPCN